jgi:hypothetical protein
VPTSPVYDSRTHVELYPLVDEIDDKSDGRDELSEIIDSRDDIIEVESAEDDRRANPCACNKD